VEGCQCRTPAHRAQSTVSSLKSAQSIAIVGAANDALSDRGSNGNVVLVALMRNLPSIAVSLWLGGMGCFAFLVAPAAFATLDREAAGRLVSVMFPRYYVTGIVLGAIALASCVGRGAMRGWRGWDWLTLGLVVLMLALTLYAWAVVLPAAHAAREALRVAGGASTTEAARFARLHRLSGGLNAVVMVAGIVFLVMEVTRRL
jgi:uncharacterized membrane protein